MHGSAPLAQVIKCNGQELVPTQNADVRKYTTKALRLIGGRVVSATGLPRLLHSHLRRKQVTILAYHAVVATPLAIGDWCFLAAHDFRQQLDYLEQYFRVVPISTAVELMKNNAVEEPTAVITFDDGYQNNYDVAFPILADYELPATIFLTTSFINSPRTGWWCRLNQAFAGTCRQYLEWEGQRFDLGSALGKERASATVQNSLKAHRPSSIESLVEEISRRLDCVATQNGDAHSPYQMLSTAAIREMGRSGIIEFGAHTHTHPILSLLSKEEQSCEIDRSLKAVAELTGKPCTLFAYPNGRLQDYDQNSIDLLKSRGVTAAVSMVAGPNDSTTEVMELRRYGVASNLDRAHFQAMVHHMRV
jgi:peptidoglycan/xylan/chitin deacetylase (PgdA/CDA1 family)